MPDLNNCERMEWKTPGQSVEGYYDGFVWGTGQDKNGKPRKFRIHVLRRKNGTRVSMSSTILDNRFGKVSEGDYVTVRFGGARQRFQNGATYLMFHVYVGQDDVPDCMVNAPRMVPGPNRNTGAKPYPVRERVSSLSPDEDRMLKRIVGQWGEEVNA
jgi:hypothetical protein